MQFTYALSDIDLTAAWLWQYGHSRRIWLLDAEMGAGKTTLTAALCRYLGAEVAASSPTFSIINEYPVLRPAPDAVAVGKVPALIVHMDLYRLRDADEAMNAGVEDYLRREDCLCIVEWPELAAELMAGQNPLHIAIAAHDDAKRTLTAT